MATLSETLTAIANRIRENAGLAEWDKIKLENMPKLIDFCNENGRLNGIQDGILEEYDRFWDEYQNNGERKGYNYSFAGSCWRDTVYDPKYPIICESQSQGVYMSNMAITNTKVPIIFTNVGATNTFMYCMKLKTIESLKVTQDVTFTSWFSYCEALETINFTEDSVIGNSINFSACVKLSHDTIVGIFRVLSTAASEKTLTLSKTAVNNAFETTEGAKDGSTSDEWKTLVATKTNWTISLVQGDVKYG